MKDSLLPIVAPCVGVVDSNWGLGELLAILNGQKWSGSFLNGQEWSGKLSKWPAFGLKPGGSQTISGRSGLPRAPQTTLFFRP